MFRFLLRGLWLPGMLLFAAPALADEGAGETAEEPTRIDFDDDTISGDLQRPDGELIEARQRVQHSNLIQVRTSFREQVLESIGDL